MAAIQRDSTKSEAQAPAESSGDIHDPEALGNSEMRRVDHNPSSIVSGMQMMFGTVGKGRQIISHRLGFRADSAPSKTSGPCQHQICEQFRKDAEHRNAEHDKTVQQNKTLSDGLEQKEKQLNETQNALEGAILQNESLTKELTEREKEFRETYKQLSAVKEKEAMMRAILLERTGTDRVSDHEVKDRFLSIRQRAQVISNSSTYNLELGDPAVWGHLTAKDRKNRMMSWIFELLQYYILNNKVFCQYQPTYKSPDPKYNIEADLGYIERIFEHNNVNKALIADWRIATLECLSELIGPSPKRKMIAAEMFATFVSVISPKSGATEQQELHEQFQIICDEAWELAMIMRRSREGHRCIVPPTGTRMCLMGAYQALAEPITVEGGKNEDSSDEIAYSLFGALVKGATSQWESEVVLEKAQVVLKRR